MQAHEVQVTQTCIHIESSFRRSYLKSMAAESQHCCMYWISRMLHPIRCWLPGKHLALQALEEIRGGILSGRRVELPSAQRQAH